MIHGGMSSAFSIFLRFEHVVLLQLSAISEPDAASPSHSWKSTINDWCAYNQWQAILDYLQIALRGSWRIIELVFYPHFWQI